MPRVKVTRNYQVTIPSEVRSELGIREGDYLEVQVSEEGYVIMKKVRRVRKILKSGRKLTIDEIDEIMERGRRETLEGRDRHQRPHLRHVRGLHTSR